MMLQEYQSAYFHFFRLKMTQSIGLEKSANLFDFSYKYFYYLIAKKMSEQ